MYGRKHVCQGASANMNTRFRQTCMVVMHAMHTCMYTQLVSRNTKNTRICSTVAYKHKRDCCTPSHTCICVRACLQAGRHEFHRLKSETSYHACECKFNLPTPQVGLCEDGREGGEHPRGHPPGNTPTGGGWWGGRNPPSRGPR
jgi:hypothetical protein